MFSGPPDADSLLREYRRKEQRPLAVGGGAGYGRILGGGSGSSSALADVDDIVARMEARVARLATETFIDPTVAPVPSPVPTSSGHQRAATKRSVGASVRRAGSTQRPADDRTGFISELATLEREAKGMLQEAQVLRARICKLEEQCSEHNLPICLLGAAEATATDTKPIAVDEDQHSDAADLSKVVAARVGMLRRQAPQRVAHLHSLRQREEELSAALAAQGIVLPRSSAFETDPCDVSPTRLLRALSALSEAVALAQTNAGVRNPTGVHGLGRAAESGRQSPAIPVTVFSDGLMLFRGPFRAYNSEAAASFVGAVLTGQLPYELKQAYPDGVTFELFDNSSCTHARAVAAAAVKAGAPVEIADVTAGLGMLAPQDARSLLARLPQSVVRDGNILPVRSEVAELVCSSATACPQPVSTDEQEKLRRARLRRFGAAA